MAEHVVLNAARLWAELSIDPPERFQKVLFPEGFWRAFQQSVERARKAGFAVAPLSVESDQ